MLVALRDVPRHERHLLFCSRFTDRRRPQRRFIRSGDPLVGAINRSLARLGESVDRHGLQVQSRVTGTGRADNA